MTQRRYDIVFENLSYRVGRFCDGTNGSSISYQCWSQQQQQTICLSLSFVGEREILKSINGEFRACELTAILGQSGSGKTSLLNILSGYTRQHVSGSVNVNDIDCDIRKRSTYIMQDYTLHRFITTREAMNFAANFTLGDVDKAFKNFKVTSVRDLNPFQVLTTLILDRRDSW